MQYFSQRLRLDLNYFLSNGFWLGIGELVNILKGFIISILFANFLSKEIFGQYQFVIQIISILTVFALPAMINSTVNAISKKYYGTYYKGFILSLKWSFLGSIGLILASVVTYYMGRSYASIIFLAISVIFPLYATAAFYRCVLFGLKKFKTYIILNSIFNIISTIAIVSLFIFSLDSVFWLVFTTIASVAFIQGYFSLVFVRKYITNKKVDKKSLELGQKLSYSLFLSRAALNIDGLILALLLGFEELAIFAIVTFIPNQLKSIINIFNPLILPKLASQKKDLNRMIFIHLKKIIIIILVVIIGYAITAPLIFKYFYSQYYDYVWLSVFFNLSFIVTSTTILEMFLIKNYKTKYLSILNIVVSAYLLIGSFFWIYFFGLYGAIINRVLARFLGAGISIYYTKKVTKNN